MSDDSDSSEAKKFVGQSTLSARVSRKEREISPRRICAYFLSEFFYLIEFITGVAAYRCGFYKYHEGYYGRFLAFLMKMEKPEGAEYYVSLNLWPLLWSFPTLLLNYYVDSYGNWDLISLFINIVMLSYFYMLCLSIFSFLLAALQKFFEKCVVQQKFPKSALHKKVKKIKKRLCKRCCSKPQNKSTVTQVQYSLLPSNGVIEPEEDVFTKKMVETFVAVSDDKNNLPAVIETTLPVKE